MSELAAVAAAARRPKGRPNAVDQHVGGRVRLRRLQLGLSQQRLGDALGLSFQQVWKYENGINRVGAGRLAQIAAALQVEVAYFFAGAAAPRAPAGADPDPVLTMASHPDGLRLALAFNAIAGAPERAIVVRIAQMLAGRRRR